MNKMKIFYLVFYLLIYVISTSVSLKCFSCHGDSCFDNQQEITCKDQSQFCSTSVYYDATGSKVISKGCIVSDSCFDHKCSNDNCSCCCHGDLCNKQNICEEISSSGSNSGSCDLAMTSSLPNGQIVCSDESNLGSICRFSCNTGYLIVGDVSSVCDVTGWSSKKPTCELFDLNNYNDFISEPPSIITESPSNQCLETVPRDFVNGSIRCEVVDDVTTCGFVCREHSILIGESVMKCKENWNSSFPICVYVPDRCVEKPSSFPHGHVTCSGNGLTEICRFECDNDYVIIGASSITCSLIDGRFRTSSKTPECRALITNLCEPRPSSFSDVIGTRCQGSGFGEACSFTCQNGGTLLGPNDIICSRDSSGRLAWSASPPSCSADNKNDEVYRTCSDLPEVIENGRVICTGRDVEDLCFVACDEDFEIDSDSNYITCIRDQGGMLSWSGGIPNCVVKDKYPRNCFPIYSHIENGRVKCQADGKGRETCSFDCDENFSLHGASEITCESLYDSGFEWSDKAPRCISLLIGEEVEKIESCLKLPAAFRHGSIKCVGTEDSEVCTFHCEENYYLMGVTVATCNRSIDGDIKWNADIPICSPLKPGVKCHEIEIENGNFSCKGQGRGQVCEYMCDDGYVLMGASFLECIRDNYGQLYWNGQYPKCILAQETCSPRLNEIENGKVRCVGAGLNEVCEFNCLSSYDLIGDLVVKCVKNEEGVLWNTKIPSCKKKFRDEDTCTVEVIAPKNGRVLCECEPHRIGTICLIACDSGYDLIGEGTITCQSGIRKKPTWSSTNAQCQKIENKNCPTQTIPNGVISCTNGNFPQSKCQFQCNNNYELIPKDFDSNVCLATGSFDSYPSCCQPICPPVIPGDMLIIIDPPTSTPDWDLFVDIIINFINQVILGEDNLRIGLISWSEEKRVFIEFSTNKDQIIFQINNIKFQPLQDQDRLIKVLDESPKFFEEAPRRRNQPKSVVVFTNNEIPRDRFPDVASAAERLDRVAEVMSFGFGTSIEDTLDQISGQGSYAVFHHWQKKVVWEELIMNIIGKRMCRSRKCTNSSHFSGVTLLNNL